MASNENVKIPKCLCESLLVVELEGAIGREVGIPVIGAREGVLFDGRIVNDGCDDIGSADVVGESETEFEVVGASVGCWVDGKNADDGLDETGAIDKFGDTGTDDGLGETGTGAKEDCCVLSIRIIKSP